MTGPDDKANPLNTNVYEARLTLKVWSFPYISARANDTLIFDWCYYLVLLSGYTHFIVTPTSWPTNPNLLAAALKSSHNILGVI